MARRTSLLELKIYKELPKNYKSLEQAAWSFVEDNHVREKEREGLYQMTLDSMIGATILDHKNNKLWIAEENGEVKCYVLTSLMKDVDNRLCCWITQAWVCKELRRTPLIKIWRKQLYEYAKQSLCKHILIPSSRSAKAYLRWLGPDFHQYITILKKDI